MRKRIVITGIGVVSPNATGSEEFSSALLQGKSGIKFQDESSALNFRCQVAGVPNITDDHKSKFFPKVFREVIKNNSIIFGCLAGMEAWTMANLPIDLTRKKNIGMVFGAGSTSMDGFIKEPLNEINSGNHKVIGTTIIPQSMNSGTASYLNQILGIGGPILSNSSACSTGSEAILLGFEQIQLGKSDIMLCGSTEGIGRYIWGAFDTMRILASNCNEDPEAASKPLSKNASGFVPSGGAGALVLETLESAQKRGVEILAEIIGVAHNCGGQREGGSMTAPNPSAAKECIESAIDFAGINPIDIDLISGHLTATKADPLEIQIWIDALKLRKNDLPQLNTLKSMIGHAISAAGAIESVACVLQIRDQFIHPNINLTLDSLHEKIAEIYPPEKIVLSSQKRPIETIIKSNFGFGDVNCTLIFRKFKS